MHNAILRAAAEALRSSHDPDEGLSDEALVAEAASLRKRMESMATRSGGLVTSKGGGSSSPSSGAMAELEFWGKHQQAAEIERMAVRVNQIDQALKRRQTLRGTTRRANGSGIYATESGQRVLRKKDRPCLTHRTHLPNQRRWRCHRSS